ncbi:MAG TPA: phage tail protein [Thermodesulfovibrionales bacterium]|nr:phage tail protein [Thermodesulfovibrionales bacterium]
MPTANTSYPYATFRFRVEIDGITVARFSEVSGLMVETETEQYEEGGVNDFVHYLPKRTKYQHIILKRGLTDVDELWQWYQDVVAGRFQRKNGAIVLMDSSGEDALRWNFSNAYPVKWTGPDLRADSNTVAFETIEIVHHGIQKG